jgi:hypothetical protein
MPTDSYVVEDTWNTKYVSTYTSPTNYATVLPKAIGLVPIRTEAECDTIIAALNAIDAGRWSKKPRPH